MAHERHVVPGFGNIRPYQQGELSSFCGIYAAINAARLLAPELAEDRTFWKDIYAFAVAKLSSNRQLKHSLTLGLTYDAWKTLQDAIYEACGDRATISLRMRPLVRRHQSPTTCLANEVRKSIRAGRVILCAVCNTRDHFTVIGGYTRSRWLLQDSSGMRWLEAASTSIGNVGGTRNWLPRSSLIALHRSEKR